jgi:hypothetical protein
MTDTTGPRWLAKYRLAGESDLKRLLITAENMENAVFVARSTLWRYGKAAPRFFGIEPVAQ